MLRSLLYALLVCCAFTRAQRCAAQEMDLDSLRAALRTAPDDTSYARATYYLARNFFYQGEPDSVARYARLGTARLDASTGADPRIGFWLVQLWRIRGMGWYTSSKFDSAIVAFQQMYRLAEQQHIRKDMGAALSYQGFALRQVEDEQGALAMVCKAIGVLEGLPPGPDLANCYHELGALYGDMDKLDSSIHWHNKAGALYTAQGNKRHLISSYVHLGESFFRARRWHEADSMQRLAGTVLPRIEDPSQYVRWVVGETRMLLRAGEGKKTVPLLDSAIALAQGMDEFNAAYHLHMLRSLADAEAGRMTEAFADQALAMEAHATDLDLAKVRATEKARSDFEHEKTVALAHAEAANQRLQKWGALALGILGLLLALVWYRSYRMKSKANEALHLAQAELVKSEKQREAELVRTRIARDIHDDIGATLTKIALLSGVASQRTQDAEEAGRSFNRISEHAKHVSRALSDVVWAVDPQRDTHQGMLDHVRDLSQRLLGDNGIRFVLDLNATDPDAYVQPALKRDLHLVLNECFNNVLKYAHAKLVRVRMDLRSETFELRVDDDGIGFDPAQVPDRGNGLKNMPARIAQHGGRLSITSAPGKGTVLHAHGPLV